MTRRILYRCDACRSGGSQRCGDSRSAAVPRPGLREGSGRLIRSSIRQLGARAAVGDNPRSSRTGETA